MIKENLNIIEVELKENMREYKTHYLSEKGNPVYCPISHFENQCNNRCAWFDNVNEECALLGELYAIKHELMNLNDNVSYIGDKKDVKRE